MSDDEVTVPESLPTPQVPTKAVSGGRFPSVEGLRAIAALSVVVYHTVVHYNVATTEYATWEFINRFGNFGVSTFFLISGLLLYRPYVVAHFTDAPEPARGPFWARRFLRIMPAYWLAFAGVMLLGFEHIHDLSEFLMGAFLLQNYRFGYELYGIGVEWTLVIEVSFYLLLPFIALVIRSSTKATDLDGKLRAHLRGLAVLYVIAMATRIWYLWVLDPAHHIPRMYKGTWFPLVQVSQWIVSYLDWFALGMLLAVLSAWSGAGRKLPWQFEMLGRNPWASWAIAITTYWVALQLHLPASVFDYVTRTQSFGIAFTYGIIAFFLLVPAVFGPQDQGRIRALLQSRVMRWLGMISYGLYLWHLIVVKQVEEWSRNGDIATNVFLWLALVLAIAIPIAALSWYLVEKPLVALSHRMGRRSGATGGAPQRSSRPRPQDSEPVHRRELWRFVELFALSGIAIAQPMLDLIAKNSSIVVTNGVGALGTIALCLLIVVVPPVVVWVIGYVIGTFAAPARLPAHFVGCGLFVGVLVLEVAKHQSDWESGALYAVAILGGILAVVALSRIAVLRQFVRFLAIGPLLFSIVFLGMSPVTDLVFTSKSAATVAGVKNPKRVVLIVLDELPTMSLLDGTGKIDAELFPNFARLAKRTTWYRNETTVAPFTQLAVPAILTGAYPKNQDALPSINDYPDNVFTLLRKGYALNVHESATRLCPASACASTSGGFGHLLGQSVDLWQQFAGPTRTSFSFTEDEALKFAMSTARGFIRSIGPASDPRFDFVHIELPHQPWHYLPSLQDTGAIGTMHGATKLTWSDSFSAGLTRRRHLLQLQATDTLLGRSLDRLDRAKAWDDSMVVVTADHGVSFGEGEPLRSASATNYPEILWTPLFIHYPGQTGAVVDDRPAQSVDVLPTIADVIGVKIPWHVDGHTLRGAPRPEFPRRLYQWKSDRALQPPNALVPAAGTDHIEFEGPPGFARVLRSDTVPERGDPDLRVYRFGDFGALVGRDGTSLISDTENPEVAGISNARGMVYKAIDTKSDQAPWAYAEGFVNNLERTEPLALLLDGRVVAVTQIQAFDDATRSGFFMFIVPPSLVRDGDNHLTAALIRGTPEHPTLDPIPLNV